MYLPAVKAELALDLLSVDFICLQFKTDQGGVDDCKDTAFSNGFTGVGSDFKTATGNFRNNVKGSSGPGKSGEQNLLLCRQGGAGTILHLAFCSGWGRLSVNRSEKQ